jgi:hypothetical protein
MFQVIDAYYHTKSSKHGPPGLLGQWFSLQSGCNDYVAMIVWSGPRMYKHFVCGLLTILTLICDNFITPFAVTCLYDRFH